jgi:hypothetical protein
MRAILIGLAILLAAPGNARSIDAGDYDAVKSAITVKADPYDGSSVMRAPQIRIDRSDFSRFYYAFGAKTKTETTLEIAIYVEALGRFSLTRAAAAGGDLVAHAGGSNILNCGSSQYSRCLYSSTIFVVLERKAAELYASHGLDMRVYADDGTAYDVTIPSVYMRASLEAFDALGG